VIDLDWTREGKTRTVRRQLPEFVSRALDEIYRDAQLARGCPDLVIWNPNTSTVRLVEIKCPHWDRPSREQKEFMLTAEKKGIVTQVVEWEFLHTGATEFLGSSSNYPDRSN